MYTICGSGFSLKGKKRFNGNIMQCSDWLFLSTFQHSPDQLAQATESGFGEEDCMKRRNREAGLHDQQHPEGAELAPTSPATRIDAEANGGDSRVSRLLEREPDLSEYPLCSQAVLASVLVQQSSEHPGVGNVVTRNPRSALALGSGQGGRAAPLPSPASPTAAYGQGREAAPLPVLATAPLVPRILEGNAPHYRADAVSVAEYRRQVDEQDKAALWQVGGCMVEVRDPAPHTHTFCCLRPNPGQTCVDTGKQIADMVMMMQQPGRHVAACSNCKACTPGGKVSCRALLRRNVSQNIRS